MRRGVVPAHPHAPAVSAAGAAGGGNIQVRHRGRRGSERGEGIRGSFIRKGGDASDGGGLCDGNRTGSHCLHACKASLQAKAEQQNTRTRWWHRGSRRGWGPPAAADRLAGWPALAAVVEDRCACPGSHACSASTSESGSSSSSHCITAWAHGQGRGQQLWGKGVHAGCRHGWRAGGSSLPRQPHPKHTHADTPRATAGAHQQMTQCISSLTPPSPWLTGVGVVRVAKLRQQAVEVGRAACLAAAGAAAAKAARRGGVCRRGRMRIGTAGSVCCAKAALVGGGGHTQRAVGRSRPKPRASTNTTSPPTGSQVGHNVGDVDCAGAARGRPRGGQHP